MATKHSKNKTFSYFRARFTPEPYAHTMQELLNLTFDGTKIKDRIYKTSEDAKFYHFINHKADRKGFFCAELFAYEKGKISHVIKENLEAEEIQPEALVLAKAADGSEQQYLDGKLYFVCFENHIVMVQEVSLRSRHLEAYLYDRISERNKAIRATLQFMLERSMSQKVKKQISGVKRVNISSPLDYSDGGNAAASATSEIVVRKYATGRAWDAVKAFVKDKIDLTEFTADGFIDPKDIDVTISLAWKSAKKNETTSDELDAIANAFRHVEDELEVEIETKSGTFKKNDIRLSQVKSVVHYDDRPEADDIFDKMIDWYRIINAQGQI